MGAGSSKPEDASKHVFSSGTPVRFSQELIDALQASTETNSSRAKTLELHIAERVAAELEKIQKFESDKLESLRATISPAPSTPDSSSSSDSTTPPSSSSDAKATTSQKVHAEIERLKQTLAQRKVLKDLPPDVDKARNAVVSCLRLNDRRPLDCWAEVEAFKTEVRRMEDKFIGDVL